MKAERFFKLLLIAGTSLCIAGIALMFKQGPSPHLITQNVNEYLGPTKRAPGNSQLVKIQILINDDPNPEGVQIVDVQFNQTDISLKPRDIYGFRGQGSFQLAPGKYRLKWTVRRDRFAWPRTVTHEEEVQLNPKDLWIQISIIGDDASIS